MAMVAMDEMEERTIRDELVHQHRNFHFEATPEELHDVSVIDLG
jgi:hypothetical protein